jgi:hypothetical protein
VAVYKLEIVGFLPFGKKKKKKKKKKNKYDKKMAAAKILARLSFVADTTYCTLA